MELKETTNSVSTLQKLLSDLPGEASPTVSMSLLPDDLQASPTVSMSLLPDDLQDALINLVADLSSINFQSVQTTYFGALKTCRGIERLTLSRATVETYLELTATLFKEQSEALASFLPSFCDCWLCYAQRPLLLNIMRTSGAEHFARLLRDCLQRREDVAYALRAALTQQRDMYVKWFCTVAGDFSDLAQTVVDIVWNVRHDQLHALLSQCLCFKRLPYELALRYLVKTFNETDSWMGPDPDYDMQPLVESMSVYFQNFRQLNVGLRLTPRQKKLLPYFAQFCIQCRASVVAIFLVGLMREWPLVMAVLERRPEELGQPSFNLRSLQGFLRNRAPLDVVVESTLAVIDRSVVNTLKFNSGEMIPSELCDMASVCQLKNRPKWVNFFLMHTGNWSSMSTVLPFCTDPDATDMTLLNAARCNRWNLVETLLPLSSSNSKVLLYVFQRAARECKVDLAERLLPRVDLSLLPFIRSDGYHRLDPLGNFHTLVDFAPVTDMVSNIRMVLLLVRQGLATHIHNGEVVLEDAIFRGMPTVARLLLDVGMVSKKQFDQTLQILPTRSHFSFLYGRKQAADVVAQDARLDCPRTLQDSCRLILSHHIGFEPGRQQRIEQLLLPRKLQSLVALSDLCDVVEAKIEGISRNAQCF